MDALRSYLILGSKYICVERMGSLDIQSIQFCISALLLLQTCLAPTTVTAVLMYINVFVEAWRDLNI